MITKHHYVLNATSLVTSLSDKPYIKNYQYCCYYYNIHNPVLL